MRRPHFYSAARDKVTTHTFAAAVCADQVGTDIAGSAAPHSAHIGIIAPIIALTLVHNLIHSGTVFRIAGIHLRGAAEMVAGLFQPPALVKHRAL